MAQIKKHVDSLTAVLVLVIGTVPCVTVGTDAALSMLSAIFPYAITDNLAFLSTNVPSPLYVKFPQHTLPGFLKDAPQFLLDNPVALQKNYLKIKDGPDTRMIRADFRKAVKTSEQDALEMLVDLFDRLDSLEPQSIAGIVPLYEAPQNITKTPALMGVSATTQAKDSPVRPQSRSARRSARTTVCLFSTTHPR